MNGTIMALMVHNGYEMFFLHLRFTMINDRIMVTTGCMTNKNRCTTGSLSWKSAGNLINLPSGNSKHSTHKNYVMILGGFMASGLPH